MIKKIIQLGLQHKLIAGAVALAIIGGGYYATKTIFSSNVATRYAFAQVQKGTLIVSISGTGQVSVSNQIDIKPKVSGDVLSLRVKNGQAVARGTLLVRLDDRDAQKTVRDAEVSLESAKLALERLKQSSADIGKILDDAFGNISDAFLDFPTIIEDAKTIIIGSTFNPYQSNYGFYVGFINPYDSANQDKINILVAAAKNDYADARSKYDAAFLLYKNTSRYADSQSIESLLSGTSELAKSLAQSLKSEQNVLDFLSDYASTYSRKLPTLASAYEGTLKTDIVQVNSRISTLTDAESSLKNVPLDIKSQELAVKQRENALLDAREKLEDYSVRAPFDGVIAKVNAEEGDSVSSAGVIATILSRQKFAEISLNEVDIAQIKMGQKATLTFDAIPGLTITGQVAEIDTVGTVSQGVVTYDLKIGFDTQDEIVKPGMSVSAAIITDAKPNILLIPNSAVKTQANVQYVELPSDSDQGAALAAGANGTILKNPPRRQNIQIGAANDEFTEVVKGLNEGDLVITRTIQPGSASANRSQTSQQGGLRIPGLPTGGGGSRAGEAGH